MIDINDKIYGLSSVFGTVHYGYTKEMQNVYHRWRLYRGRNPFDPEPDIMTAVRITDAAINLLHKIMNL